MNDFNHYSGYSREDFSDEERQKLRHMLSMRADLFAGVQDRRAFRVLRGWIALLVAVGSGVATIYGFKLFGLW